MILVDENFIDELLFGDTPEGYSLHDEIITNFDWDRKRISSYVIIKETSTGKFYRVGCEYGTGGYGCMIYVTAPLEVHWVEDCAGAWQGV